MCFLLLAADKNCGKVPAGSYSKKTTNLVLILIQCRLGLNTKSLQSLFEGYPSVNFQMQYE